MQLSLKKLVEILNKDISLSFRSVDESAADDSDSSAESPVKDGAAHPIRMLTAGEYVHQAIPRKSEQPFQLRYAAYGESSSVLCSHSYAWHDEDALPSQGSPNALSLAIEFDSQPISSVTIVFDTKDVGLLAAQRFPQEYALLRGQQGGRLVELTGFAFSKVRKSRRALAGLMHMIFLYTRQAKHMDGMLVQTRPHHAGVFEQLMGFKVLATRENVVLLFISLETMRQKIRQFSGRPDLVSDQAGLYKYFFDQKDEAGLLVRMLQHLAASGTSEG